MESEESASTLKVFEKDSFNGRIKTKLVITKKVEPKLKKSIRIKRWLLFVIVLFILFLLIVLISAIVFLLTGQRPGLYHENCKSRSCESSLNMKCINGTCDCTTEQYFLKGCKQKKALDESCTYEYECKSNLACLFGKCSCDADYYWSGILCTRQKIYADYCSDNSQCLSSLSLYCFNGLCSCDTNRFWTGLECKRRSPYGQLCKYSPDECLYVEHITCSNNLCVCNETYYYYDSTVLKCEPKKNETESCSYDYQCLGNMTCLGVSPTKKCECPSTYYFDYIQLQCLPKTFVSTLCQSTNRTCRTDLGLSCQSNICLCDASLQFWYNSTIGCVNYLSYGESSCSSDSDCLPGKSLFCNLNPTANQCNCNKTSAIGMCDCTKVSGNESYWDYSLGICVPAKAYNSVCSMDYECRTLTEKTYCSSGRCICVNGTDVGFLKPNGICGYCTGGKIITSLGKCFQTLTLTGTSCPQKSFDTCLRLKCNETFASSSIAILSSPTIFNETISALLTTISFSTGTYIGGYFDAGLSTWKWDDGSSMSTVIGAGEWSSTSFTGLNSGSNNICLMIEASSSPVYFTNTDCNRPLNVLCQTTP